MNIQPLIDRWQTNEGKPYKGRLIDMDEYLADPTNPGCMCAQGQVLHYAGWASHRLNRVAQHEANREVAKLLNISLTHSTMLRIVNDRADGAPAVVLTDPGAVLGDQWSKVLDFWWHLDSVTVAAWDAAQAAAQAVAREESRKAAGEAAGKDAWEIAWLSSQAAVWENAQAAAGEASAAAAWEIQCAEIMRRDGRPFCFLPIFGFAAPADIPARPADYGPFTGE
jgi:hypothetical protein